MKATTGELCTWLDTFCEGTACAQVPLSQLLVVYDDLDLPTAAVRLRAKGGHGGHNGMRSIVQQLGGSNEFPRVRIGELIQRTALMLNFGLKDEYRIDSYQIQDYIEIQCLSESGKRNLQYICCMKTSRPCGSTENMQCSVQSICIMMCMLRITWKRYFSSGRYWKAARANGSCDIRTPGSLSTM